MAQTIKLKRSANATLTSGQGIPTTSNLELGEVAINTYHGKMYIKKNDGSESIVEVGAADNTKLPLSGGTLTGTLAFGDSTKLKFGNSQDLEIFHDGSHSRISDLGTGRLVLETNGDSIRLTKGTTENMAIFTPDGSVDLYHNNIKKFETSSTGISVTGGAAFTGNLAITKSAPTITLTDTGVINGVIQCDNSQLILDSEGDILLDADGADIIFADGGTQYGFIANSSSDMVIKPMVQDKDFIIKGNDGGSTITALTLDMSDGGAAFFNDDIRLYDTKSIRLGTDQDFRISFDGSTANIQNSTQDSDILFKGNDGGSTITALTLDMSESGKATFTGIVNSAVGFERGDLFITANEIDVSSGDLTLDVAGDIVLDADGADILLKDAGTEFGRFSRVTSDFVIKSATSDKDIIFKGNDGGSTITALTLDMSEAGAAIFSGNVTVSGNLEVTGTTTQTGSTITNSNFTGLSNANAANATDFGFYGKYVESSTTKYAGMYYDASTDNTFKLFCDTQTAPTTTVNESATGYALANLSIAALTSTGLTVNAAQSNFNDSAGAVIAFQKSSSAKAWIANRSYGFHDGNGLAINTTDANPIRFGTNNSEKMRLDSSGRLGIGTTSPSFQLHVDSGTTDVVSYFKSSDNKAAILISDDDTNTYVSAEGSTSSIGANPGRHANNLNILSTGNVGIGTTSPPGSVMLDVEETTADADLILGLTAGTGGRAQIRSVAQSDATSSVLSFHTMTGSSTSERMRLDSSGNLYVGKTSAGVADIGVEARGSGILAVNRDGNIPVFFGRKTSDGTIIQFRKDTTVVGAIAVQDADNLYISSSATNHAGLKFGTQTLIPMVENAQSDNTVNIGTTSARFHDAYLGGKIYVGEGEIYLGTAGSSSGHLNAYENMSFNIDVDNDSTTRYFSFHKNSASSLGTELMRLTEDGSLFIASTSDSGSNRHFFQHDGFFRHVRSGQIVGVIDRLSSDGDILKIRKDGSDVGTFGSNSGQFLIDSNSSNVVISANSGASSVITRGLLRPLVDNTNDLGQSNRRFKDLYLSGKSQADTYEFAQNSSATNATDAIYRATTATIAFKTGGSEKMRLNSTGLGIGTSTLDAKLHVNNTSQGNFVEGIRLENSGGGANEGVYIQWEIANTSGYGPRIGGRREGTGGMGLHFYTGEINATPTEKMRLDHDGKLGIGTTAPARKLSVETTGTAIVSSFKRSDAATAFVTFSDSSTSSDSHVGVGAVGDTLFLRASNVEKARINNTGFGIGTTSPDSTVDITTSSVHGLILNQDTGNSSASARLFFKSSQRINTILNLSGNLEFRTGANIGASSGTVRMSIIGSSGAVRFNDAYSFPTADGSTGQALITDGSGNISFGSVSAGAASSMVDADGDTKIQVEESSDEDKIRFDTAGSERMIIDASGNVGIGTSTNLVNKLSVNGNQVLLANGELKFADASNFQVATIKNSGGASTSQLNFLTSSSERMRIDSSGNVGIGESSPVSPSRLHIKKTNAASTRHYDGYVTTVIEDTEARLQLMSGDTGNNAAAVLLSNESKHWGLHNHGTDLSNRFSIGYKATSSSGTDIIDGLTDIFNITTGGNVGIGTTSPASNLHIKTSVDNSVAQGLIIERSANSDRGYINYNGGGFQFRSTVGDPIVFGETDAEHMRILPDGNVGIGTTSPLYALQVVGSIYANTGSLFLDSGKRLKWGNSNQFIEGTNSGPIEIGTGGAVRVTIDSSGNVGIGTTSPGKKLDVVGTIRSIDASSLQHQLRPTQLISYGTDAVLNAQSAGDDVRLNTQNSTVLIATAEGKVGIGGITAPKGSLTINNHYASASSDDIFVKSDTGVWTQDDPHVYNAAVDGILVTSDSSRTDGPDKMGLVLYNDDNTAGGFSPMLLFAKRETGSTPYRAAMAGIYAKAPLGTGNSDAWIDGQLHFATAGAASYGIKSRMVINKEGLVGIGTTTPARGLQIHKEGNHLSLTTAASGTAAGNGSDFKVDATSSDLQILNYESANTTFWTSGSERMRINSSGDWMVSNTVARVASQHNNQGGCGWYDADHHFEIATTTNRSALEVSRNNANDGDIITFRKQGNVIGGVGVSSSELYIGTGDVTLRFEDGNNRIVPRGTNGVQRDNAITLGSPGNRFHDAYFGGTVNVGENLVVTGDLTINGTTTTLNTATLNVEDKNIVLNYGSGDTSSTADGAGITIQDAVNSANDASFTWNAAGDKFLSSHPIRAFGGFELPDNNKLIAGDSSDLQIFHDGSNSYIQHGNTGNLNITTAAGTEFALVAQNNGSVFLYHDGTAKFQTTSGGASVTGALSVSGNISSGFFEIGDDTATTTATTQVSIASFSASSVRSCKLLVQVTNTTDSTYHFTEIAIIHDGTDTYMTEYGSMFTGAAAEATFTSDISSGSVRLLATPASTDSMTFKVVRQMISA